ncbi:hypothetical protein [Burkholderia multivorans]|uniref:hypothetical protein n=1 Tax=Burkholderia multivorans TaxID=87883 RepID=UPI0021BE6B4E|nr:hypothetical protein [Burkholderia multivorans]
MGYVAAPSRGDVGGRHATDLSRCSEFHRGIHRGGKNISAQAAAWPLARFIDAQQFVFLGEGGPRFGSVRLRKFVILIERRHMPVDVKERT